ncbi:MAG: acyl-CoA dehydrogenase family protein [Gammaproteobacteria bacterium]|nr:acyl-CoA dehydrogenase family protein [Gammaproteobacteria bacterium]
MDFQPSARILDLCGRIREILDRDVLPLEPDFLTKGFDAVKAPLDVVRGKVKAAGLWAPNHPVEYGGMGLDLVDHGLVSEVLGRCPLGHYAFGCQAPDAGNIEMLHLYGTPEQKAEWMPRMVGGERSCFVMTERDNSGANPIFLKTTARREGDEWVLNGNKWFITSAPGCVVAFVMAATDPSAGPHARQSVIIVPGGTPGFIVERNTPVMGHANTDLFAHCEVRFDNCRVPYSNLLGREGQAFHMAQARLGPGRIHHCMRWLGICARSLELMCQHASSRVIGEPDRRMAESDIIRAWIAEAAAGITAARLITLYTAWRIEKVGAKEARNDISMIKYHCAEVLQKTVDRALQVHGSLGMTDYTVLAYFYREERASRIYDGPDEVHKLAVAKRVLSQGGKL